MIEINRMELKEKIENGEKLMVDFWGSFCGPCKVMKPWFEKVANELNQQEGVKLYTFNIDNDRDFVIHELGIRSVPTIKGFSGGKEVYNNVGVLRESEIKSAAQIIHG